MEIIIEPAQMHHLAEIRDLYRRVAVQKDGIIRHEHEITQEYIQGFLEKSLLKGLILLARKDTMLIGEIHAYIPDVYAFRHILSDLTIVVHPDYQGMGVGRNLFKQLAGFNPFFDPEFVKQS
jgi:putative acetyltransferase